MPIFEKKLHIIQSYLLELLVNVWNRGKKCQDLRSENHWKVFDDCNIWPFNHDFYGLKYLDSTRPLPRREKFTKFTDCQIVNVIKVLGYSNIAVY